MTDILAPIDKKSVSTKPSIDNYSIDDLLGELDIDVSAVKKFDIVEKIDDGSTVEVEVELDENPISEFDSEPETIATNESGAMATTDEDIISAITTAEDDIINDTEKAADVEEVKPATVKKTIPKKAAVDTPVVTQPVQQSKKTVAKKQPAAKVQEVKHVVDPVIIAPAIVEDAKPLPFDSFDTAVTKIETPTQPIKTFKQETTELRNEIVSIATEIIPPGIVGVHTVTDLAKLLDNKPVEEQDPEIKPKGLKKLEKMNMESFEYIVKTNLIHIGFDIDKNDVPALMDAIVTSCDEFVKKTSLRELLKALLK